MPDIALPAGVELNAYVTCSADADGGAASSAPVCTDTTIGFATGGGGAVGGTSAATPNVAAILAIIEQANGGGALGNINPSLYKLAAGSSASSIFHDITSGNNIVPCKGGTPECSSTVATTNGTMGYTAGTGYDQVTGLGSIVAPALQAGLKSLSTTTSLLKPSVSLSLSNTSPGIGASVIFTATVSGSGATPTGAITFSVDGTTVGSAVTLASGTASYTYSGFTTSGQHTVIASYSGDGAYTSGTNTVSVTVNGASPGLTLSAAPTTLTITSGSSGNETLTVTSTNGYTGSVGFTATSSFPGCYALSSENDQPGSERLGDYHHDALHLLGCLRQCQPAQVPCLHARNLKTGQRATRPWPRRLDRPQRGSAGLLRIATPAGRRPACGCRSCSHA